MSLGFSVFNSVAIAASHARKSLGCKRVLIVDWDVHHGNGIQHIFESDPNVMYFSVHRYDEGFFFPATDTGLGSEGTPSSVGMGEGRGTTINIGWNTNEHSKPGDSEYLAAWRDVLMQPAPRSVAAAVAAAAQWVKVDARDAHADCGGTGDAQGGGGGVPQAAPVVARALRPRDQRTWHAMKAAGERKVSMRMRKDTKLRKNRRHLSA